MYKVSDGLMLRHVAIAPLCFRHMHS